MTNKEITLRALQEIQDRHAEFFLEVDKTIFDYVIIYWTEPVSVRIVDRRIDPLVNQEIIELFHIID